MKAAQIVVDIVDAGGFIVAEKGEIVARHVPRHLIPHIREHKAALLALLSPQPFVAPLPTEQCADDYAMAERRAIQAESMEMTPPHPLQRRTEQIWPLSGYLVGNAADSSRDRNRYPLADAWQPWTDHRLKVSVDTWPLSQWLSDRALSFRGWRHDYTSEDYACLRPRATIRPPIPPGVHSG